jgi:hypothetical protein
MDGMYTETKYKPYYPDASRKDSFKAGIIFQDFVIDLFIRELGIPISIYSSKDYQIGVGENRQGFEIKYDSRILETGNVSIEVAEKSKRDESAPYVRSGILRRDNTIFYVQGNLDIVFLFSKRELVRRYYCDFKDKVREFNGTIKKFHIPLNLAKSIAIKFFELGQGGHA